MPPRKAFEAAEAKEELFPDQEVWSLMTPEQQARAVELRTAIARSGLAEYGVTEQSLRVVMTENDGKNSFFLTQTGSGIDIGEETRTKECDPARSYHSVMLAHHVFQFKVGDTVYDSRMGMTSDVYDAKVADLYKRMKALSDSLPELQVELGELQDLQDHWTMLTGESRTETGRVKVRSEGDVDAGAGYLCSAFPLDGRYHIRVCPTVEIV